MTAFIGFHLVFQSTLPRGERQSTLFGMPNRIINFNPRSREGSDLYFPVPVLLGGISIHAPARGATHLYGTNAVNGKFQSTLPRGERRHSRKIKVAISSFQSTLPRGERRTTPKRYFPPPWDFNPRSREGSDG